MVAWSQSTLPSSTNVRGQFSCADHVQSSYALRMRRYSRRHSVCLGISTVRIQRIERGSRLGLSPSCMQATKRKPFVPHSPQTMVLVVQSHKTGSMDVWMRSKNNPGCFTPMGVPCLEAGYTFRNAVSVSIMCRRTANTHDKFRVK